MTYLEHVTTYFVGLIGKGVSLSSRDLAIVQGWEAQGIPPSVACRALRQALRRRGATRRTSLADLEIWMELPAAGDGGTAARDPASGPPGPADLPPTRPPTQTLLARLVEVGQAAPNEPLKAAYRCAYRQVQRDPEAALTTAALAGLDELVSATLQGGLPDRERRALERDCAQRAGQLLGSGATPGARDRLAAALLEEHLCEKLGLVLPSELLRGQGAP